MVGVALGYGRREGGVMSSIALRKSTFYGVSGIVIRVLHRHVAMSERGAQGLARMLLLVSYA